MALPKINSFPTYELQIPSTKQSIRYRPFLVKEQKVLLMALESEDEKQIMSAMVDTLKSCVLDNVSIDSLTTYDVEYIFVNIRAKSVGETSTINLRCQSCSGEVETVINLQEIKVNEPSVKPKIKLNDQYTVEMKYPKYSALIRSTTGDEETLVEMLYRSIAVSLDKLYTDDEVISFADESEEEINSFIESLTTEQFNAVVQFVESIPTLTHNVNYKCNECGHDNTIVLKGAQDFF